MEVTFAFSDQCTVQVLVFEPEGSYVLCCSAVDGIWGIGNARVRIKLQYCNPHREGHYSMTFNDPVECNDS